MEQAIAETNFQLVRFRDNIVQIQTAVIDGSECLCLEDIQRRFPSVSALGINDIQLTFLRDEGGHYQVPLRIQAIKNTVVDAFEPAERQTRDTVHTLFDHIDAKIHEMDKKTDLILANTQETLTRIKHVMSLMYELHEYTTPRYFFILPVSHRKWTSITGVQNLFLLHYKLFFLCECSNDPDHLHIAPHDGYSIKKPSEFIANYGSYLRTTLRIARGLLSAGGFVLPYSGNTSLMLANALPPFVQEPTNYTEVNSKLDVVEKMLNETNSQVTRVDPSIIRQAVLPEIPLQGAQLRELEAFLDFVDDKHSLGNLYRTITDDGHVRWVCLEHYNTIGFNNKMLDYVRQLESIGGKYDSQRREALLTGDLTSKNVIMICNALKSGFTMLTLVLECCSIDIKDLDKLFDVIINRSSIYRLIISNLEVRQWMRTTKFICNHIMIYLKNQSLKVQFSHNDESMKILIRLFQQNKICRTFHFHGYDLPLHDEILFNFLKVHRELTSLIIDHLLNIDFLNAILTSSASLRRLKLSFWFNSSSTLFGLCQAIQRNQTLTDLDLIDHTCVDDKSGTIELLKTLQTHPTIEHLRLHIFDVQSANENEQCLIDCLLHHKFITHLRISQSNFSHELTQALIYASNDLHSLTYLDIYDSQLKQDLAAQLQLLYTNESLSHLFISNRPYSSIVVTELQQELQTEILHYRNCQLEEKIAQAYAHSSICLDQMELTDHDMDIVSKQAIAQQQCQLLSLQSNKITAIGCSIIANALIDNHTLEMLYLNNNYISDDGVNSLAQVLSNENQSVRTLILQNNRITDRGAHSLAQMLAVNRTLIWLYLGENQISDEGIRVLTEVLSSQNTTLEMLVISSNKLITDTSVDLLCSMIEQNQTLTKLWIDNCNLSETGKQRFQVTQQLKQNFYIRL
ncbi:unnamed protein product [Adineta ricciae]|uniref:Uncharacterized protein n=1 Tax=Adineta ricciae TaxID=249248 RepID=A0A815IIS5_ADIRI|nr:unnamed protein product [Adineta ricciae]